MSKPVLHHGGTYVIWSTMTDSPITTGMDRLAMVALLTARGERTTFQIMEAIEAATAYGTSFFKDDDTPERDLTALHVVSVNRAGVDDTCIDGEDLLRMLFIERTDLETVGAIRGGVAEEDEEGS
jgi:hypothetical protein